MADIQIIVLTPDNIADYGVCGYKDVKKHLELRKNRLVQEILPKSFKNKNSLLRKRWLLK